MASLKTKFTVGLFVVVGFAVAFVAIIWLGMSHYFEKGHFYVAYFDESVQGLGKDSPVKYRGVQIGRVDSISVAPDATLIQVVLKIESDMKPGVDLVGQLKSVGITGIMFVELDRKSLTEPDLSPKISFPSKFPVIATKPSDIKKLFDSFEVVLRQIQSLDLKGISDQAKITLNTIHKTVRDLDTKALSADLQGSLEVFDHAIVSVNGAADAFSRMNESADRTIHRVDTMLDENRDNIRIALDDFRTAMRSAHQAIDQGTRLMSNTDEEVYRLMRELTLILQNLQRASDTLGRTLDAVSRQPSQLIFSPPPPDRTPATLTEEP